MVVNRIEVDIATVADTSWQIDTDSVVLLRGLSYGSIGDTLGHQLLVRVLLSSRTVPFCSR